jgi:hypothetical protein
MDFYIKNLVCFKHMSWLYTVLIMHRVLGPKLWPLVDVLFHTVQLRLAEVLPYRKFGSGKFLRFDLVKCLDQRLLAQNLESIDFLEEFLLLKVTVVPV